jgi:hypothetical protein
MPLQAAWGSIQAAVRERVGTAELWQRVNTAAQAAGYAGTVGGLREMNRLRSLATGIRTGAERLARAEPHEQITSRMLAPDINAQSIAGRSITPVYRVRYAQTIQTLTGQLTQAWRTASFPVMLPPTKADLYAELEAGAISQAETYGEQHVAIADIEITVV